MYSYNRRPYISREPEKKTEKNIADSDENININSNKAADRETINLLLESVNEINKSIKKLEETLIEIASRLVSFENHFEFESNCRNIQSQYECKSVNNQIYSQNNTVPDIKSTSQNEETEELPMMPGAGFSHITADYLKKLTKNK